MKQIEPIQILRDEPPQRLLLSRHASVVLGVRPDACCVFGEGAPTSFVGLWLEELSYEEQRRQSSLLFGAPPMESSSQERAGSFVSLAGRLQIASNKDLCYPPTLRKRSVSWDMA